MKPQAPARTIKCDGLLRRAGRDELAEESGEALELAGFLAGEVSVDSDLVGQRMLLDLGAIDGCAFGGSPRYL